MTSTHQPSSPIGPGQAPQQYGHYQPGPPHPHPPGAPMPGNHQQRVRRPVAVWIASLLLWIQFLSLLAIGATAIVVRLSVDWTPQLGPPFDEIGALLAGAVVVLGVIALFSAVVLGALSIGAFRRSNGCRWTLIVLFGLSALAQLPLVAVLASQGTAIPAEAWLVVLALILYPVVIVTLFLLPPNAAWYRRVPAPAAMPAQQMY